ncbi:sugar-binding domain-containing protein [Bellilinea sp.]|uniref:sugar-binding domain-containing protein n=1 Tax=Bellilinea sp. TaxID=2838785 RepID=UPI002ADE8A40|nr:sugar-binding domain-containing protein [Bellilinea sp.]
MVILSPPDEHRLLVKVSRSYYEEVLFQNGINLRLNFSFSQISRLLQQARKKGIVQFLVIKCQHVFSEFESRLVTQFKILEAIVVPGQVGDSAENIHRQLAISATDYLKRTLSDSRTLGIWRRPSLNHLVVSLPLICRLGVKVVKILGRAVVVLITDFVTAERVLLFAQIYYFLLEIIWKNNKFLS